MSWDAERTAADEHAVAGLDDQEADAELCGCAPRSPSTDAPAPANASSSSDAAASPPRTLKLVLLLQPIDIGYRAQLAVGADGCDPELRVQDVPDLLSALAMVPAVLASAEARWQVRARYPAAQRAATESRPRPHLRAPGASVSDRTGRSTQAAALALPSETSSAPAAPAVDQLPLFG